MSRPAAKYSFGPFEMDVAENLLQRDCQPVPLTAKAFDLLAVLLEHRGHLVEKQELLREVWGDAFVEEAVLSVNIATIRRALAENGHRYIETVPKRGYRFVAPVRIHVSTDESAPASATAAEQHALPVPTNNGGSAAEALHDRPRPNLLIRRWLTASLLLGFVLVAAGALIASRWWRNRTSPEPVRIASIVVLPLENLSPDPEQEYFADGMTDELTTDLAKIHALRVISRNTAMQYKGKHKPVPQIARELNVDAVVEGTVARAGNRVRITAQLIAAQQDRHLWADTYQGELRDVLTLQDSVTRSIAQQISIQLTPQEQAHFERARPVDPRAHQAYLQGMYELRKSTMEGQAKAVEQFQRAIAIDPKDALAYEGLAMAYTSSPTAAPKQVMPLAEAAAMKAIELDDSLGEAHSSLGFVKFVYDWDWAAAERELRRGLELSPNSPLAHAHYGRYLLMIPHRGDEAIQLYQQAVDLDPGAPFEFDNLVGILFFARRYQSAIDEAARQLDDKHPMLALSYAELGRRSDALAVAGRAAASARTPVDFAQVASAYGLAGDARRAHALLDPLVAPAHKGYLCGMNMAAAYSVLGEADQAMTWLEQGYRDRSV